MKRSLNGWFFLLLVFVLLTNQSLYAQAPNPDAAQQQTKIQQYLASLPPEWIEQADQYIIPGEVLVGLRGDQANQVAAAQIADQFQMNFVSKLEFTTQDSQAPLTIQRWQVPIGNEWNVIAALQDNPAIAFAEPNWLVRAAELLDTGENVNLDGTTTDSAVEVPYKITDSLYTNEQWYLQRINASRALSLLNDTRNGLTVKRQVVVAIIDSGIDRGSPEFSGHVGDGFDFIAAYPNPPVETVPSCDPSVDSRPVTSDEAGHGSHVAGLVAAGLNNGAGIASLAGSVAFIQPLKVLDGNGSGSVYNVAAAIKYASLCLGTNIINMSLEVPASSPSTTFQAAVQFAHQHNVLQIAAGGNHFGQTSSTPYPAGYPEVMGVAALDYFDLHASYSTAGDGIDLAAPGGDGNKKIYSTWSRQASVKCKDSYLEFNGGAYCFDLGTSMATPLVVSVAALVWSIAPSMTHDQLFALLKASTTPIPQPANYVGTGIVDASVALRKLISAKLQTSPSSFRYEVTPGASAFTVGLRLDSLNSDTTNWMGTITNSSKWLTLNGGNNGILSSSTRYGESSFITFVISPTTLATGFYEDSLTIVATLPDSQQQTIRVPIALAVGTHYANQFLPLVANQGGATSPPAPPTASVPYHWETPVSANDRTSYTLFDATNIGVSLPTSITFPLDGSSYKDFRIYSDGFITFPSAQETISDVTINYCLPNVPTPGQAIYGWWTNLNPGAAGSQVSTFAIGSDRFVIEYKDVPTVANPVYKVSFQIVLYRNGNIGLNYQNAPTFIGSTGPATVGVEAKDGRLAYLLACNAPNGSVGQRIIGKLPEAQQSYLIKSGDIY
ncbi:MAG: S8 family serine peptidase [Caldilineaceae bacterium]